MSFQNKDKFANMLRNIQKQRVECKRLGNSKNLSISNLYELLTLSTVSNNTSTRRNVSFGDQAKILELPMSVVLWKNYTCNHDIHIKGTK